MNLKAGTKVRVLDGYGNVIVEQAEVTRYAGGGIVFVRECTADGLLYGLPISATEPVEINTRPPISAVVGALRTAFSLRGKNDSNG